MAAPSAVSKASPEQDLKEGDDDKLPLFSGTGRARGESGNDGSQGDVQWSRWRRWLVLFVLWLAQVFMTSAYSLVAPFFPLEAARKGSDSLTTGVIISASPFCLVIATPLCGYFLPKMGMKFTLVSGMFLVGGAFFLMGFLVDLPPGRVFVAFGVLLRMTEGVGWAMCTTTTLSLLAQLFPTRVGTLTGLVELATGLGFTVGPPVGSLLFKVGGFHIPFWSVGVGTLILAGLLFFLVTPTGCSSKVLSLWTVAKLLTHLSFSILVIGNAVVFISFTFLNPTFAPFLSHQFGLDQLQIGLMFIVVAGMYLIFALFIGRLSDKLGTRKFILTGSLISGISLFFVGPAPFISRPRLWITIAGLVGLGVGAPQIVVPTYSDLLKQALWLYPDDDKSALTSVVSGLITFSMSLGEFSGALLGGLLMQLTDFPTTALLIGELVLAQAALVLGVSLITRLSQRRESRTLRIQ